MSAKKPIKVFYSPMTGRFYATQHYKHIKQVDEASGHFQVTGKKYDVTDDIGFALTYFDIELVAGEPFDPTQAKGSGGASV